MTPIISPWLIYFVNCFSNMIVICVIIAVVYFTIGLINVLTIYANKGNLKAEECSIIRGIYHKSFILSTLFIILASCIPSTDTCYKMIAANMITYENVDLVNGLTKDMVDYIFEKIEGLNVNE